MKIDFDSPSSEDIDTLVALMRELYDFDATPFDAARARARLRRMLDDPTLGRVWMVRAGDEVAGYAVLAFGYSIEFGRDAFLDEIYLRERYRGRGIGRRVVDFVERAASGLGVESLHLEVERRNTPAQGFYRRIGYVDHDRYLMTKRLPPASDP